MLSLQCILFDYLKEKKIIIYGCGYNGKFVQWVLMNNDVKVAYMCDRNEKLWGTKIYGVECISPDMLGNHKDACVLVALLDGHEVINMLEERGFCDVLDWDDLRFIKDNMIRNEELSGYREYVLEQNEALKQRLLKNSKYKDRYKGQRCFIIGNGPSVNQQDLSLLKDEITFTVNQMPRNPQFVHINSQYHVWADPDFFDTDATCEGELKLLEVMKNMPMDTECFFPYEYACRYVEEYHLEDYINVNYYTSSEYVGPKEEIDITKHIAPPWTVVQCAIRLAIYMGFKQIYILGCEATTVVNVVNAKTRNYQKETHCYEIDEKEKERAKKMYSRPMQEYYISEKGALDDYQCLKKYCEDRNIKLVNCTPGGLVENLPREDYEKIVMERRESDS